MKIELSTEQVEKAARAGYDAFPGERWQECKWERVDKEGRASWLAAIRAAAPFLQMPIEEPTEEELRQAFRDCASNGTNSVVYLFVRRRNAQLTAQPDPKRAAFVKVLQSYGTDSVSELADALLSALDSLEVKP